jgi:hypothetical protein
LAKDLKAAGHDIWLDQLDIPTGARWDDELEKALRTCSSFLILLSPESIKSQNVKDEIGYAIDSGKHILPLMIKQCEVPFRLRRFQYVDFTNEAHDEYDERFEETKALLSNTAQLPTATEEEKSSSPVKVPVSKPEGKKLLSTPILIGGGALIVAILIAVFSFGNLGATPPAPTAAPTLTDIPVKPTETAEPKVIVVTSTSPPTATLAPNEPTPEPQPFFTEEFNDDLSKWSDYVVGASERGTVTLEDGNMIFDLNDRSNDLFVYKVFDGFTYSDVTLETVATNRGKTSNAISLICRYTSAGWYEFRIANSSEYWIYAHDSIGAKGARGYIELRTGFFPNLKGGSNTYVATCSGNELSLSINGEHVHTREENLYQFGEGKIGLSVLSFPSYQEEHVIVEFESLKISEPE